MLHRFISQEAIARRGLAWGGFLLLAGSGLTACRARELDPEAIVALTPLKAVCEGGKVAEAADYDPKNATPPIVAMVAEGGSFTASARYLDAKANQALTVKDTQLVLCVAPEKPELIETCRYSGAGSYEIPRFSQKAGLKLVSAKTGKVLSEAKPTAEAKTCADSLTSRKGSDPSTAPLTAEIPLMDLVKSWSLTAIASAAPPVDAPASQVASPAAQGASDLTSQKGQCNALEAITKSEFGDGKFGYGLTAQISVQAGTIQTKLLNDESKLRVTHTMGKKAMADHLPAVAKAIAQAEGLSFSDLFLQGIRDRFLTGLKAMEKDLKAFEGLVKESAPAIENQPIDRPKLQAIAPKMQKIANSLTQQSKDLSKISRDLAVHCSTVK